MVPTPLPVDLPDHLKWLQSILIDLWIDQEGFRAVYPTFKLVGYTEPDFRPDHPSTSAGPEFPDGTAEFIPVKRESFVFHHGTFDTPPLMRRLIINGDETRDYLTQHAYLGLKSRDDVRLYRVVGAESKRAGHGGDERSPSSPTSSDGSVKLEWLFEYTAEDRRKPDGAKMGYGEKVLTPLRFSCSPALLHPKQGRKITMLQVWKKSVQPKYVANRVVAPPLSPTGSGSELALLSHSSKFKNSFKFTGSYKMGMWNINSNRRPNQYNILEETDFDDESDGRKEQWHMARRNSMSSIADGLETEEKRMSGRRSHRSRSLDAKFVDLELHHLIHPENESTESLEKSIYT